MLGHLATKNFITLSDEQMQTYSGNVALEAKDVDLQ